NWLPIGLMKAVNGLMDCVTSPERGSLKTGIYPSENWQSGKVSQPVAVAPGIRSGPIHAQNVGNGPAFPLRLPAIRATLRSPLGFDQIQL
ncbi:MAG TPA: hypothetical protein VJ226_06325, partial [Bradyrhizobium sp.]|nr:hypothetical protein [Bradyrhizobium sp.]